MSAKQSVFKIGVFGFALRIKSLCKIHFSSKWLRFSLRKECSGSHREPIQSKKLSAEDLLVQVLLKRGWIFVQCFLFCLFVWFRNLCQLRVKIELIFSYNGVAADPEDSGDKGIANRLYLLYSRLNHSCDPNSSYSNEGHVIFSFHSLRHHFSKYQWSSSWCVFY